MKMAYQHFSQLETGTNFKQQLQVKRNDDLDPKNI